MQFCDNCGAVLNLLEFPDEELCYSCRKKRDADETANNPPQPPPEAAGAAFDIASLANAVLSHENNQMVLRSPEGWILWSCPDNTTATMEKIVARAERILEIRKKRKSAQDSHH